MSPMSVSVHDVRGDLRATSLDERHKGDNFERLVLNLLRTEPEWVNRFSDVWLWTEWPERDCRRDTGIDLVAKHKDRDGHAAIQCKFCDLDTCLAAGAGPLPQASGVLGQRKFMCCRGQVVHR